LTVEDHQLRLTKAGKRSFRLKGENLDEPAGRELPFSRVLNSPTGSKRTNRERRSLRWGELYSFIIIIIIIIMVILCLSMR